MICGLEVCFPNKKAVNKKLSPDADVNRAGMRSAVLFRSEIRNVNDRAVRKINVSRRPRPVNNDIVVQPLSRLFTAVNIAYFLTLNRRKVRLAASLPRHTVVAENGVYKIIARRIDRIVGRTEYHDPAADPSVPAAGGKTRINLPGLRTPCPSDQDLLFILLVIVRHRQPDPRRLLDPVAQQLRRDEFPAVVLFIGIYDRIPGKRG